MTYEEYKKKKKKGSGSSSGQTMTYEEYKQKRYGTTTPATNSSEAVDWAMRYHSVVDGMRGFDPQKSSYTTDAGQGYGAEIDSLIKDYSRIGQSVAKINPNADKYMQNLLQLQADIKGVNDYYSQFGDEDSWQQYLAEQKILTERLGYDTTAGQQKIDAMKADLERFEELSAFRNSYRDYLDNGGEHARDMDTQSKLAQYDQLAKKYGDVDALNRAITAEEVTYNQSKRAQKAQELAGVSIEGSSNYDPQFAHKSAYESTELDNAWQKMWSEYGLGYDDLTYEFINDKDGTVREQVLNTAKKGNGEDYEKWKTLAKLDPEEIAIYNYHYKNSGKEVADEFIDSISESLSGRRAEDRFAEMQGKTGRELAFGVQAGFDQFGTGLQNVFSDADYIPVNSTQYTSQMVREDLADDKLFKNSKAKTSLGQAAYDTITTTTNMVPSILASVAIGAVSKTAGSAATAKLLGTVGQAVGSGLMGASAAGNAYQEKLNAGYSKDDARAYGVMVGASEIVMEKALGGITALGGGVLSETVLKNISVLDNALGKFAETAGGKILANAGSEALEEFTQSVIEPYMWQAISGEEMSVDWGEAFYSALLGAVTGGFFESVTTGAEAAKRSYAETRTGKSVINTKDGLANLNAAAASASSVASPESQKQIAKAQEKAAKGGARAVGQLHNAVSAEVTKADTADIVKSLNRKGIKGDAATQMADIIVGKLGNKLTSYGEKQFNAIMRDKRVQTVVSDLIDNKMSTVGQRNQKLAAATGKEASTIDVAKIKEQQRTEFVEENNEYDVAADQQTINTKTGAAVKVNDIAEITDKGVVNVQLDDGSVVNAADLSYATEDIALAYSALKGKPMSAENANRLFKMSEGMDAAEFYEAVEDGYERGYANLAKPEGDVAAAAYEAGAAQRASEGGKTEANKNASGINYISKKGDVTKIDTKDKSKDLSLNKRQRAAVSTMQTLQKLNLGTAFYLFESRTEVINGEEKIVFTDEHGKRHEAPNGMYYKDGRIYIDINAGAGRNGRIMLQTVAHELTHHIQEWNAAKYKVLADFLAAEYGKRGVDTYSAIKAKQQELSDVRGSTVSFNEAYHEFVADSLSVMFNDGNLYNKLVKLKQTDSALFNELNEFISKLAEKVRKLFNNDRAETAEGRFVQSWDAETIERLQQIFAEALVEVSKNYNAAENGDHADIDMADVQFADRYWYPKMTKNEIAEVKNLAKQEAKTTNNYLGIDTKWLYNNQKGHRYFALYSTAEKEPTLLYACKNDSAEYAHDMLMDIIDLEEGIYESANPGSTTIGEILSRAENAAPGQTRNYSGSARTGSNIGNATVYSKNKRIKLDAAFINCLKNIQKVQQQYSVDDYYQFAVDIGDDIAAQSMVDDAARAAGYTVKAYHGTPVKGITVFDAAKIGTTTDEGLFGRGFYFTTNKLTADGYASVDGETMPVFLNIKKPWWGLGHTVKEVAEQLGVDETILTVRKVGKRSSVVAPLAKYAGTFSSKLLEKGYDSLVVQHGANNYEVVVFDNAKIKSADPVTYDDAGNVIPLSKRFNAENNDIRYSDRLTEPSTREILATALEGTAKTELEQKVISEYIDTIPKLNEQEAKLNELNAQIREISFGKGPRDTKKLNQLKTEAAKTRNRINILDKKLLRIESTVPLQRVIETEKAKAVKREKARSKDALAAAKERSAQKIAEVRKTYQESRAKSVAGRRKTEMRHKIQRVVKQLNDLLLHETKEKHIPKNLKKAVADALDFVNMDTVGAEERIAKYEALIAKETDPVKIDAYTATIENIRRQGERSGEMLNALKDAYKEISKSNDPEIMNAYDAEIYGNLAELAATIGNTSLRDMTIEQLQDVYSMYRMVLTTVQNANKLFREGRKETLVQLTQKVYNEIDAVPHKERDLPPALHKVQRWLRNFSWNELRPVDAFDRVGSKEFTELFWDIIKAQGEYGHMVQEVEEFITSARKKNGYSKWDLTKAKTYDTVNGKQFKVTLADAMSIYAYSKRDQAHDHMTDGGFTYDTGRTYKDEKNGKKVSPVLSTPYRVTDVEIGEIIGSLTKEQKAYVDEVQQFLTDFGKKGNVVSNALWGIDLFTEKMYFPLKSSKDYRSSTEQALNATQTMVSLKNTGITKSTVPHANNPIVLRAFDDVVLEHLDTMSKYAAYVLPVENIQRVFNSVAKNSNEDYVSIQSLLTSVFGDSATAYFNQYIKDINGNTASVGAQNPIGSFFSKSKAAAVAANLSVVIQQYSAVTRAMAEINPKFFNLFVRPTKTTRKTYEEIKKYAGVAVIKEMGGFDVSSNRGIKDFVGFEEAPASREKAWKKFQDITGWGAQQMDKVGWNTIWRAVKRETTASGKFKAGSEEFYQECGRRFTEVVTKTQVYDSVNSRSGFMRSKSDSVKYLTTYMGEPTVTVGMVFRSHLNLVRAIQSKQGVGAAAKNLARTGVVLVGTMALNAALKSIAYAMRDDDEDESFVERWAKAVGDSIRGDLNIFSMLPVFRDITSIIEGWDVERPDMTVITEFINATTSFVKPFRDEEKMAAMEPEDWWNSSVKLVGAIGNMVGVPLKNIIRDATGVVRLAGDITDELKPEDVGGAFINGLTGKEESKAESLYGAIIADETSRLEFLRSTYDSEADYEKAVKNALRDNDERIEAAAEARYSGNWSEYERIFGEIEAEGKFTRSQIAGAVESAMNDLEPDEVAGEAEVKTYGIYNKNDLGVAVFSGDAKSAAKIRNEIVKFMVAEDGKTKDEANKTLDSFIRDSVKDWLETGDVNRTEAISALTQFTSYGSAEAKSKVDYWMYTMANPNTYASDAWMAPYYEYAEPAGINIDTYMGYRNKIRGIEGEGKKERVLVVINDLPITTAQKDALYFSHGWAESRLYEAPWH